MTATSAELLTTRVSAATAGTELLAAELEGPDGAADRVECGSPGGTVTEAGVRLNVNGALQDIGAWLHGTGAAGIFNLMEDTATAEISRAQLWQWIHRGAALEDGRKADEALYRAWAAEERAGIRAMEGRPPDGSDRLDEAGRILDELVIGGEFTECLTGIAYDHLV